jgi:hypothetical protein
MITPSTDSSNNDPDFDPEEITEDAEDFHTDVTPPEVSEGTKDLTSWEDPPKASGGAAPKVLPEDEVPAVETFTYEGVDEADREQRIAAADPDFEP